MSISTALRSESHLKRKETASCRKLERWIENWIGRQEDQQHTNSQLLGRSKLDNLQCTNSYRFNDTKFSRKYLAQGRALSANTKLPLKQQRLQQQLIQTARESAIAARTSTNMTTKPNYQSRLSTCHYILADPKPEIMTPKFKSNSSEIRQKLENGSADLVQQLSLSSVSTSLSCAKESAIESDAQVSWPSHLVNVDFQSPDTFLLPKNPNHTKLSSNQFGTNQTKHEELSNRKPSIQTVYCDVSSSSLNVEVKSNKMKKTRFCIPADGEDLQTTEPLTGIRSAVHMRELDQGDLKHFRPWSSQFHRHKCKRPRHMTMSPNDQCETKKTDHENPIPILKHQTDEALVTIGKKHKSDTNYPATLNPNQPASDELLMTYYQSNRNKRQSYHVPVVTNHKSQPIRFSKLKHHNYQRIFGKPLTPTKYKRRFQQATEHWDKYAMSVERNQLKPRRNSNLNPQSDGYGRWSLPRMHLPFNQSYDYSFQLDGKQPIQFDLGIASDNFQGFETGPDWCQLGGYQTNNHNLADGDSQNLQPKSSKLKKLGPFNKFLSVCRKLNSRTQVVPQKQSNNGDFSPSSTALAKLEDFESYSESTYSGLQICDGKARPEDETSDTFILSAASEFLHSSSDERFAFKNRPRPGIAPGRKRLETGISEVPPIPDQQDEMSLANESVSRNKLDADRSSVHSHKRRKTKGTISKSERISEANLTRSASQGSVKSASSVAKIKQQLVSSKRSSRIENFDGKSVDQIESRRRSNWWSTRKQKQKIKKREKKVKKRKRISIQSPSEKEDQSDLHRTVSGSISGIESIQSDDVLASLSTDRTSIKRKKHSGNRKRKTHQTRRRKYKSRRKTKSRKKSPVDALAVKPNLIELILKNRPPWNISTRISPDIYKLPENDLPIRSPTPDKSKLIEMKSHKKPRRIRRKRRRRFKIRHYMLKNKNKRNTKLRHNVKPKQDKVILEDFKNTEHYNSDGEQSKTRTAPRMCAWKPTPEPKSQMNGGNCMNPRNSDQYPTKSTQTKTRINSQKRQHQTAKSIHQPKYQVCPGTTSQRTVGISQKWSYPTRHRNRMAVLNRLIKVGAYRLRNLQSYRMSTDQNVKRLKSVSPLPDQIYRPNGKLQKSNRNLHNYETSRSQTHISDDELIDFYAYLSIVPSEIDELVLPFRACNRIHRIIKKIRKLIRHLNKTFKKSQYNSDSGISVVKSDQEISDSENNQSSSPDSDFNLYNLNRLVKLKSNHSNPIHIQSKNNHIELTNLGKTSWKNSDCQIINYSNFKSSRNSNAIIKPFNPIRKKEQEQIKFWQNVLHKCHDSRLSNLIQEFNAIKDRRLYAIEVHTQCRFKLDETRIYSVRGQPCLELRIIGESVGQLQMALVKLEELLPWFYSQLIFSERFYGIKSIVSASVAPTTDEFLFKSMVNPVKKIPVFVNYRRVPVIEAARGEESNRWLMNKSKFISTEPHWITEQRIYDQIRSSCF